MYRVDTSARYRNRVDEVTAGGGDDEPTFRDPGVRGPRSAPRSSDARLRAAQTTQYVFGDIPCLQLRDAVPLPQDAGRERLVDRGAGEHAREMPRSPAG